MTLPVSEYREIKMSNGPIVKVTSADFEWLSQWSWYCHQGYAYHCTQGFMHRLILGLKHKDGKQCDHINNDTHDNRRANLRVCSQSQNNQNTRVRPKVESGYKGVERQRKCWRARIGYGRKKYFLGSFKNKEMAALAYNWAALMLYGKDAGLNVIPGYVALLGKEKP